LISSIIEFGDCSFNVGINSATELRTPHTHTPKKIPRIEHQHKNHNKQHTSTNSPEPSLYHVFLSTSTTKITKGFGANMLSKQSPLFTIIFLIKVANMGYIHHFKDKPTAMSQNYYITSQMDYSREEIVFFLLAGAPNNGINPIDCQLNLDCFLKLLNPH
jgi:hypothetical protein